MISSFDCPARPTALLSSLARIETMAEAIFPPAIAAGCNAAAKALASRAGPIDTIGSLSDLFSHITQMGYAQLSVAVYVYASTMIPVLWLGGSARDPTPVRPLYAGG